MTAPLNLPLAEALAALPAEDFFARLRRVTPAQQTDVLRHRLRIDRATFLKWCFPSLFSRAFNPYHCAVLARPKPSARERVGRDVLRADAAPRGIAKTTLLKGELVHDVCYGLEDNIVIVSAEMRLARKIAKHIRAIFLRPPKPLLEMYGPFVVEGGVDQFTVTTPDGHATGFLARSFGTAIRGENNDGARPTKIAVDDGERSDRVRNPEQRRVWWEFLHDDILRCGPIEGGLLVEWRGTVLHPDAVLPHLLKEPGWRGSLWQMCLSWPDRADLWAEAGRIFGDLTRGDVDARRDAAMGFYLDHRAEMDAGAVMLDDEAMPVFRFYEQIWTYGLRQVLRELQNEPRTAGTKFFRVAEFARCTLYGTRATDGYLVTADKRKIKFSDLRFFARLDPIPGKALGTMGDEGAGAGDYAAIAVIARDSFGYVYVIDVWRKRARDGEQLAALWSLYELWRFDYAEIESNGFARLLGVEFKRLQAERREKGQPWQLTVKNDTSTTNKQDDIAAMEAACASGQIQWSDRVPVEVISEADAFPDGDHDDGIDAVARAILRSKVGTVGMVTTPIGGPRVLPPPARLV